MYSRRNMETMEDNIPRMELVGYYSINGDQCYVQDVSELNYLTVDKGQVNINFKGFNNYDKTHVNTTMTSHHTYFEYLKTHKHLLEDLKNDDFMHIGIITNRNCLKSIMRNSYTEAFIAYFIRNNIYLTKAYNAAHSYEMENNLSSRQGHLFENYVLSASPDEKPNPDQPLNEFRSFNGIYKGRINKHRILFKCEIDGVLANSEYKCEKIPINLSEDETVKELKKCRFVELKLIRYDPNKYNRYTTSNIWMQCILNNTDDIYIGCRKKSDDDVVDRLVKTNLKELVKNRMNWCPERYLDNCNKFLTFIKERLRNKVVHNPNSTQPICKYFIYRPRQQIEQLDSLPSAYIADYIPEWYFND